MGMFKNLHLQLYVAAIAVCILFCCTESTEQASPSQLRKPTQLDMWMPLPSYVLGINGDLRTIFATNKVDDLKLYLDFTSPIINSTQQIISALHVNSGYFVLLRSRNSRRFSFELKHILTDIIKVELDAASVIDRKGFPISAVAPITFLYDSTEPAVSLSTSSLKVIEDPNINIVIEFTKPVFEFEASKAEVKGGSITRFDELSRALYSLTVKAKSEDLTVNVPAEKVKDISGNWNMASNVLCMKYYSAPSLSVGLHLFMTVGILATSLAAAVLLISSSVLEEMATQDSEGTFFTYPTMNLQGIFGHLQIFVFANWISDRLPIEFLETTKGLRWLIPRGKLPWKSKSSSTWPSPLHTPMFARIKGHLANATMRTTPFGLPLDSGEYFTYFLRGEPLSASTIINKMEKYTGWEDLEMNLFWLGVGVVTLLTMHVLILFFLRWRLRKSVHGLLSIPRFELFLLILMLPCISQASAFVIRGGTSAGTLTGILLLTIPAGAILSVSLFLIITIFTGGLMQYIETNPNPEKEMWCLRIWFHFIGKPNKGKWISKQGLPISFVSRFGILFETRKGPPLFVSEEEIIGSDYSYEENNEVTKLTRILGYARSFYIVFDLIRRVGFGIISGAFALGSFNQSLFAILITLAQFLYLIILKPYISRVVNVVEGVSLICEATLFTLAITAKKSNLAEKSNIGYLMVGLLFVTYVSQVASIWYGIVKFLLQKNSFKLGLKNIAKGLILPLLPRRFFEKEAMNATVVPVLSPRISPHQRHITEQKEWKEVKGEKHNSDMKKLRQLAKASFTGGSNYEEGSTSYALQDNSIQSWCYVGSAT